MPWYRTQNREARDRRFVPIVLQKSEIGGRQFSRHNTIQPTISDLYSLNRASEVAGEFVVRR